MARDDDDEDDRKTDDDEDAGDEEGESKKLTDEDKQWAMFAHLSSFVGGIIGPLVIMMIYKDKSKFVERHAKEALNFDITMVIIVMVTCCLGAIVAGPVSLIYHILAAMAASRGEEFKYPWCWRLIK